MTAEPSWDTFRTFAAVMRERSLSGAARMLELTQPTVARHIDALEAVLGTSLFLRTPRGLDPTDAALALQPYGDALVATTAALLRAASGHAVDVAGTVRISASEVVGVEHLPPILADLRRRYPKLAVELILSDAVSDLLQREADIAVRMTEPRQEALLAKRLKPISLGLYARQSYLDERGTPQSLEELAAYDMIGFDRETPFVRTVAERLPWLNRASLALRCDSNFAQLAAIRAGFGIGICQVPLAAREPSLVRVLEQAFSFELGLWIVMHEDQKTSPCCRAVFDALADGLGRLG